jgi:tetratricopeptide (TPR) repeat protein
MPARLRLAIVASVFSVVSAHRLSGQIPERFQNLQVLPTGIARDSLVNIMRGFSFALGVRCQHCHSGGDGVSFAGVAFDSDDKPAKRKARFMLRMVDSLNRVVLAALPGRSDPPVTIQCVTCHRGLPKPATIQTVLMKTIEESGVDSAIKQYRGLRERTALNGYFDFTEWRINELARGLVAAGKTVEAIAILEMNAEFNPRSVTIAFELGELYRQRGDKDKAIASYQRALQINPDNPAARQRLAELGVRPPGM